MYVQKAYVAGTTNSTSHQGQVQVVNDGDVLYLGTSTNGPSPVTGNLSTLSQANRLTKVVFSPSSEIIIPKGFVNDLGLYLSSVLSLVMVVCLLLVFYHFIQAGLQWITSGGDKGKTEEARNRITHAFIGIIIVSASFAMAGFIAYILGFSSYQDILTAVPQINTI